MKLLALSLIFAVLLSLGAAAQSITAPEAKKLSNSQALPCLIVASNHGMNKAIGYAIAGIGGLFMSGDRYEYRDNVNVHNTKLLNPSYKSKDLNKLMKEGVHVVIVSKHATGQDVLDARRECSAEDIVPQQTSEGVRPIVSPATPKTKAPPEVEAPAPKQINYTYVDNTLPKFTAVQYTCTTTSNRTCDSNGHCQTCTTTCCGDPDISVSCSTTCN